MRSEAVQINGFDDIEHGVDRQSCKTRAVA